MRALFQALGYLFKGIGTYRKFIPVGIAGIFLLTNFFIVLITYTLERTTRLRHVSRKRIIYEKIELIKPDKRSELIADLEERTGLKIIRVEVGRIDFMRDIARLRIYYYEDKGIINLANEENVQSGEDF